MKKVEAKESSPAKVIETPEPVVETTVPDVQEPVEDISQEAAVHVVNEAETEAETVEQE